MAQKNPGNVTTERAPLLTSLLKQVSRSFYLTLRILPAPVRPQISLAYLLARASDTIADTDLLPVQDRIEALDRFSELIQGDRQELYLPEFVGVLALESERTLLRRLAEVIELFRRFTNEDQALIAQVVTTILSGQKLDLRRFGSADANHLVALEQESDLDDYTYRVAGCVGEFWTRICVSHLFSLELGSLLNDGIRFGKGLQMVNILRDLPTDLRNGRCYLPAERLAKSGLTPGDLLLNPPAERFNPLFAYFINIAEAHLRAGWRYTLTIPRRFMRVRLACAWPLLIGIETLQKLRENSVLTRKEPIKVSRREVKAIIVRSILLYPWKGRWAGLFPKAVPDGHARAVGVA